MNEKASIMKKEIHAIANFRALIISKNLLSVLLFIISLYLGMYRYAMSPLYIAIIINVMPYFLTIAFTDYAKKKQHRILLNITRDDPFQLSNLKTKYKYTRLKYISNSISYLVAILMIGIWQYDYSTVNRIEAFLKNVPVIILTTGLAVRILGIIIYQLKLPYDIAHNKVT